VASGEYSRRQADVCLQLAQLSEEAVAHSRFWLIATEAKALNLRPLSGELRTFDYGRLPPFAAQKHRSSFRQKRDILPCIAWA
jgi:hypothetical protein